MPTLEEAIKAIKAGDKDTGREMLADILQADLDNEMAWLWLSSVVESDERKRQCLERVLQINPDNMAAKRGLDMLPNNDAGTAKELDALQAQSRLHRASALGARIATVRDKQTDRPAPAEPPPQEPSAEAEMPSAAEPADALEQISALQSEMRARQAPPPVPKPVEPKATPAEADEVLPAEPTLLHRLAEFAQTSRGTTFIGVGLAGSVLICVGCIVGSLVFRSSIDQATGQLGVAMGLTEPTPTYTPSATHTPTPTVTPTFPPTSTPTLTATPTIISTRVVADTPTTTPIPSPTPSPERELETGLVVRVASGDVIDVLIDGIEYRVKYNLINAPNANDPTSETEPFGPQAFQFNQDLVQGRTVTLEKDTSETDTLGRLLRYVYVGELMVNEELLLQGLARVEMIPPDLRYAARFQDVEAAARAAGTGIWSAPPAPEDPSAPIQ
ncbi:MAG TPA: thermonuclease family protein [Anaerolineae bacterium]